MEPPKPRTLTDHLAAPSLWTWVQTHTPLAIALLTGLGTLAGILNLYILYQAFGLGLFGLGLSPFDYLVAGLLPMGALAVLLFFLHITMARRRVKVAPKLAVAARYLPSIGLCSIVLTPMLPQPIFASAFSVITSLALTVLYGVLALHSPIPEPRQLKVAVAALAICALSIASTFGTASVLWVYTSSPLSVKTTDAALQARLDRADLRLIVHTNSTWYFADKSTIPSGIHLEAKPDVYSLPDSVVSSVVMKRR